MNHFTPPGADLPSENGFVKRQSCGDAGPVAPAAGEAAPSAAWRTIESAPRDGTEVDIWVAGPGSRRVADCRWGEPSNRNWGDGFGEPVFGHGWVTRAGAALDRRNGEPTHWMPLPSPPRALGSEGE